MSNPAFVAWKIGGHRGGRDALQARRYPPIRCARRLWAPSLFFSATSIGSGFVSDFLCVSCDDRRDRETKREQDDHNNEDKDFVGLQSAEPMRICLRILMRSL
jgi:hypothetical protein